MVDMEKDMTEIVLKVTRMAEVLKDYEVMRSQLNNVLDLLLPGDGHDLLPSAARTGPPSRTGSPGGWRSNWRGRCTGAACGRPSGPAPGGWMSRPSTCWTTTGGLRPPRPGPTRMTPPWP